MFLPLIFTPLRSVALIGALFLWSNNVDPFRKQLEGYVAWFAVVLGFSIIPWALQSAQQWAVLIMSKIKFVNLAPEKYASGLVAILLLAWIGGRMPETYLAANHNYEKWQPVTERENEMRTKLKEHVQGHDNMILTDYWFHGSVSQNKTVHTLESKAHALVSGHWRPDFVVFDSKRHDPYYRNKSHVIDYLRGSEDYAAVVDHGGMILYKRARQ
jgi:hypothetical protein